MGELERLTSEVDRLRAERAEDRAHIRQLTRIIDALAQIIDNSPETPGTPRGCP